MRRKLLMFRANMNLFFSKFFLLLFLFSLDSCLLQKPLHTFKNGNDFTIFSISQSEFHEKTKYPIKNPDLLLHTDKEHIFQILKNLVIGHKTLGREEKRILFSEKSALELSEDLYTIMNKKEIAMVALKFDDSISPATRINRVTFYCLIDENNVNLVFLEIFQNIDFLSPYNRRDWTNLELFPIQSVAEEVLLQSGTYLHKEINDTVFKNWIIIPNVNQKISNKDKNHEVQLERLKQLYEKKLIDEKSYRKKVEEILNAL